MKLGQMLVQPATKTRIATGSSALANLVQAVAVAQEAYGRLQGWREQQRANRSYSIAVDEDDDIYDGLHRWLLERVPARDHRYLTALTSRLGAYEYAPPGDDDAESGQRWEIVYRYNTDTHADTTLDGHPIRVFVDRTSPHDDPEASKLIRPKERIVFQAQSLVGMQAVKRLLVEVTDHTYQTSRPRLHIAAGWGGWQSRNELTARPPETVVLARGQMERLLADARRFLADEQEYARRGIPWHRGWLLYGAPGTGKTSVARAISTALGLPTYQLPLNDVKSDSDLQQLLSRIGSRSLLLLEDVDAVHAAVSRDDDDNKLSIAGLLNALDGVVTPQGLLVIMTTNHKDRLDPALVRSGRCDLVEEIGYLSDDQLGRLVGVMTGRTIPLPALDGRLMVAAEVIELVKRNMRDMDAARAAIVDLLLKYREHNDWQAAA